MPPAVSASRPLGNAECAKGASSMLMSVSHMRRIVSPLGFRGVRQRAAVPRTSSALLQTEVLRGAASQPSQLGSDAEQQKVTPAEADHKRFKLHHGVDKWRTFDAAATVDANGSTIDQAQQAFQSIQQAVQQNGVFSNQTSTAYWAYHLARMGFFSVQGVTGLLSARTSSTATGEAEGSVGRRLEKMFGGGIAGPIVEALATFQQDLQFIKAGYYKLPWDMTTGFRHRQLNPLNIARQAVRFVQEAADTLERRDQKAATDVWLSSQLYPPYYMNTFHYQSDGWLSSHSADVYEVSTETLFLGKQDAMQRATLVPLFHHMRDKAESGAGTKLLEVACGTGRFATFIKDNYPDVELTALDLSPYYLAKARDNLAYWRRMRAPNQTPNDTFMQAAAEDIPADDNTFDVVTCVYLFHELPADVRRKAAAEMARVVKPGGMVILSDSVQTGDREVWDKNLGKFGNFNEPYYVNYINTDLGELFESAGLEADTKVVSSSTKTLSFIKPHPKQPATADPSPQPSATTNPSPQPLPAAELLPQPPLAAAELPEDATGVSHGGNGGSAANH